MERLMRDELEFRASRGEHDDDEDLDDLDELAPGKRTLTEALAGPALPLPHELRRRLERTAAGDVSEIRIRTGDAAARAATALGARAFAIGRDIVFGAGSYRPDTVDGQRLIVHEIAHTFQQAGATPRLGDRLARSRAGDAGEREAERFADAFLARAPAPALSRVAAPGALVQGEWEEGQRLPQQERSVPEGARDRQAIEELGRPQAPIRMYHFRGADRSQPPVLLVGGMHGDERAGLQVVDILLDRLQAMTTTPPQDIYVIPILHPGNAERGERRYSERAAGIPPSSTPRTPAEQRRLNNQRDPNRDYPDAGRARAGAEGRPRFDGTRALIRVIERIQTTSGQPPRIVQVHGTEHRDPTNTHHDRAGISRDVQDVPPAVAERMRRAGRDAELAQMQQRATRGTREDTELAQQMAAEMRARGHGESVRGNDHGRVEWAGSTESSLGEWGSAAVSDRVDGQRVERPAMSVITIETAGDRASVDMTGEAATRRRQELMDLADVIEQFVLNTRPPRSGGTQTGG